MRLLLCPLIIFAYATPALAQEREYCPDRPGLGTPACTIAPGRVSVETALFDWTLDNQPDQRRDTILIGDTRVRIGLTDMVEARIGWTPFGHERVRDKASGAVDGTQGVGDIVLGAKVSLQHPDEKGFAIALLPRVFLPVGRRPIGRGDWEADLLIPVSYELNDALRLEATPEIDAAANQDAPGRHLAYGSTAGIVWKVTEPLTLAGEVQALRENDPGGHVTEARAALSAGVMANEDFQFDILAAAGLNRDTPDIQISAGIARRF